MGEGSRIHKIEPLLLSDRVITLTATDGWLDISIEYKNGYSVSDIRPVSLGTIPLPAGDKEAQQAMLKQVREILGGNEARLKSSEIDSAVCFVDEHVLGNKRHVASRPESFTSWVGTGRGV